MVSLDSTESTSGLYDINEGRTQQKSQSSYDENDEEVAEVLGEDYSADDQSMNTQPFDKIEVVRLHSKGSWSGRYIGIVFDL